MHIRSTGLECAPGPRCVGCSNIPSIQLSIPSLVLAMARRAMPGGRPAPAALGLLTLALTLGLGLAHPEERATATALQHMPSMWGMIHGIRHSPLFRLGSGAQVPYGPVLQQPEGPRAAGLQQRGDPSITPTSMGTFVLPQPAPVQKRLVRTFTMISPLIIGIILCFMMPNLAGGGGSRDYSFRLPPAWDPAYENTYSFRAYMTDLSMWVLLTDLQPQQQAASIVMRLQGSAREFARMITPQELMNGGLHNGVMVDPVTYVIAGLHTRFSRSRRRAASAR